MYMNIRMRSGHNLTITSMRRNDVDSLVVKGKVDDFFIRFMYSFVDEKGVPAEFIPLMNYPVRSA